MTESNLNALVVKVVSSYVSRNTIPAADLPGVIERLQRTFGELTTGAAAALPNPVATAREPVVPVNKSVTPAAIFCLCCGVGFKSMKRHLKTAHKLDPKGYRAAFQLKPDYPLIAPNFAAQRSNLAKSLKLGRKPRAGTAPRASADAAGAAPIAG